MASHKKSAKERQRAKYQDSQADLGDAFMAELSRQAKMEAQREEAYFEKSCGSKNRYQSMADAQEAIDWCEERGRKNLRMYKCSYCNGWHLTSKPQKE